MQPTYGGLRIRSRRAHCPRLGAAAGRAFSASLLRIHAARDLSALEAVVRRETARHAAHDWLVALLGEHAQGRSEQLQGRASRPGDTRLTPREKEVLKRIALGDTDAEAARALGIATRTVSKHVENILRKLGVENRSAAVRQAGAPA